MLEINSIEEAKEIEKHNLKITNKQNEIKLVQSQMEIQIKMIETISQALERLSGVSLEVNFDDAKKSLTEFDNQIAMLEKQKRTVSVGANTVSASQSIAAIAQQASQTKAVIPTYSDVSFAEGSITRFVTKANGEQVEITVDTNDVNALKKLDDFYTEATGLNPEISVSADTIDADKKVDDTDTKITGLSETVKVNVDTTESDRDVAKVADDVSSLSQIEPILSINTAQALQQIKDLKEKAKRPTSNTHTINPNTKYVDEAIARLRHTTSSTHVINVQYNMPPRPYAYGGAVSLAGYLPSFATGGGFKKRSGQIAGHDLRGRDDVPSLLTRGEFVQPVRAVDYYGRDFMEAIRTMRLPKFADGGVVQQGEP